MKGEEMKRWWYLSSVLLIAGRIMDHVVSFNMISARGLAAELNPLTKLVVAHLGLTVPFLAVGLILDLLLAVPNAWLLRISSTYFFGRWVGVRSGIAANIIIGVASVFWTMGWMDRFVVTLFPVAAFPLLRYVLGVAVVAAVWGGVLVILISADMEGLDFEDGG